MSEYNALKISHRIRRCLKYVSVFLAGLTLHLIDQSAALASPIDSAKVFRMKIGYVQNEFFPPYVRIDAELYSDSKVDLSGTWTTKFDEGWLDLKPNGLATITTYLYGDGLADTVAKNIRLDWVSLDKEMNGTLLLPFDWSRVERRASCYQGEWYCNELQGTSAGLPFTTVYIPVPSKISIIGVNHMYVPIDTLFQRDYFRGEIKIPWTLEKQTSGVYIFLINVNGRPIGTQKFVWPKNDARYYYGG